MTVEVTTKYATTVSDLADAWAFIMARLDNLGPSPSISITPYWVLTDDDDDVPRKFEVVVSSTKEE